MKRCSTFLLNILLLFIASACSTALHQRSITNFYQQGNFHSAEEILSKSIEKEMPQNDFWHSRNAIWLLLNRGMTRFAEENIDGAVSDFDIAVQAIDYYGQDCTLETAGQILLEDDCSAYIGSDLEHILARLYFALALWHKGDTSNAFAILRQSEEVQQKQRESMSRRPYLSGISFKDNPLAKYLFALVLEHQGDLSNADILYRQTEQLAGSLPKIINVSDPSHEPSATVVVLCHNGNVPYKISEVCDASIASAVALEMILASQHVTPAVSSLCGISIPELVQKQDSEPLSTYMTINNVGGLLPHWFDVGGAAYNELEEKKPLIVARGAARFLIRRTAVACAEARDPGVGSLIDFGMFLANCCTKADTRSWTTLPSMIDVVRYNISPGCHSIKISIGLPIGQFKGACFEQEMMIQVKAQDLCIINIFNIHPYVTTILVPPRFKPQGERL